MVVEAFSAALSVNVQSAVWCKGGGHVAAAVAAAVAVAAAESLIDKDWSTSASCSNS